MFDLWALEEMGLPQPFTEILVSRLLREPLALLFRNGYAVTRCKQLLYALRRHRCPGAFRISQWGRILVIIPRHKPTPASPENILMLRVPLKGDEWYQEITKILRNQGNRAPSKHFQAHAGGPAQCLGPDEDWIKILGGDYEKDDGK
jgi:hypothetical protein